MRAVRTVLHSDLNNFYASVECAYNPALKEVCLLYTSGYYSISHAK